MPTRSVPETTSARETTATAQTPPAAEPAELRPGVTAPAPTEAEPLYRRRDAARPPARETAAAAPVEQPERPAARAVEHEEPVRGAGAVWGASIPDLPAEDLESEIDPMTPGHGIPAVDGPADTASRTPAAPRRPDAGEFYPSPPRTSAPGTSEPAADADLGTAPTTGPGGQATGGRTPGDQGTGGDRSVPHLRAAPTHGGTDRDAAAARVTAARRAAEAARAAATRRPPASMRPPAASSGWSAGVGTDARRGDGAEARREAGADRVEAAARAAQVARREADERAAALDGARDGATRPGDGRSGTAPDTGGQPTPPTIAAAQDGVAPGSDRPGREAARRGPDAPADATARPGRTATPSSAAVRAAAAWATDAPTRSADGGGTRPGPAAAAASQGAPTPPNGSTIRTDAAGARPSSTATPPRGGARVPDAGPTPDGAPNGAPTPPPATRDVAGAAAPDAAVAAAGTGAPTTPARGSAPARGPATPARGTGSVPPPRENTPVTPSRGGPPVRDDMPDGPARRHLLTPPRGGAVARSATEAGVPAPQGPDPQAPARPAVDPEAVPPAPDRPAPGRSGADRAAAYGPAADPRPADPRTPDRAAAEHPAPAPRTSGPGPDGAATEPPGRDGQGAADQPGGSRVEQSWPPPPPPPSWPRPPKQAPRRPAGWTDPAAVAAQEAQRARIGQVDVGGSADLTSARLLRPSKRPPQSGWRRAVYVLSGKLINPGESPTDIRRRELTVRVNQPLLGCYKIAMLSLKGGVGKTTVTATLGATFASLRGDRVVAVDANPDRGTLSQKIPLETTATVRHLLRDAQRVRRYTDVRAYTSQGPSRLEVLASEQDPAVSEAFSEDDYRRTVNLLEHFYNIVLTDCGTGLMHSAMYGVLGMADQLIIVSSGSIDGARSASATMDWLDAHGHTDLVSNAVAVINCVHRSSGGVDLDRVAEHFALRCRAVVRIPFDGHLEEGAEIDLDRLEPHTRMALLELAASVADGFPS